MDQMTMDELKGLSQRQPGWCVSLYMPAHRAGRDIEQDPIHFKNLLREAEERLLEKDLRRPEVEGLLEPAQRLLNDPGFWQHQSDGLAVFLSPEEMRAYRLPLDFEELLVVTDRFHLKPLLPYFSAEGHFYLLALSQNQVRFFEGTRHTVDEIELEDMPETMREALQYERYIEQLQFHTGTSRGPGERAGAFHGHDAADEDKNRILRWFHKVDEELMKVIGGRNWPLVLAGVEYYFHLYQQANSYPHLLEDGLAGSPGSLKAEDLHAQAWPLVEPIFTRAQDQALELFHQLAGGERATTSVEEGVKAAYFGRVDTLFVAVGEQVWGRFDPERNEVTVHPEHEGGDEDLLDLAAVQTLANGGTVFAREAGQVPGGGLLAAVLRY